MPDWSILLPQLSNFPGVKMIFNFLVNAGGLLAILRYAINKIVEYKLGKAMEDYKIKLQFEMKNHEQNLQILTEEAKFKLNCLSQDYILYGKDKYLAYIEIRKLLLNAVSYVLGLRGLVQRPDFSKYSKEEAEEWLNEHQFGQHHKDQVIHIWDLYPNDAVKRMNELTKIYDQHAATLAINKLHNAVVDSEIYLSEDMKVIMSSMQSKLFDLLCLYKTDIEDIGRDKVVEHVKAEQHLAQEIRDSINDVNGQIRIELSYAQSFSKNRSTASP